MVVTLDLDGVLVDFHTAFCKEVSKQIKREFYPSNVTTYKLEGYIPSEHVPWMKELLASPKFFKRLAPTHGAVNFVDKVSKVYDLYILTARNRALEHVTREYVKKFFPGVKGVFIAGNVDDKLSLIQEWGVRVHLDDHPELCTQLALHNVNCCLYSHPFNLYLEKSFKNPNLQRVQNFDEFEQALIRLYVPDEGTLSPSQIHQPHWW